MKIPKELIKEFVKSEEFKNTGDIMAAIKNMFAEVLEETLQCEMDEKLGHTLQNQRQSSDNIKGCLCSVGNQQRWI